MNITGYVNRWSASAGETLKFYVSSTSPEYRVELRRLIHGCVKGPGIKQEVISHPLAEHRFKGTRQEILVGSCMVIDRAIVAKRLILMGSFQATLLGAVPETLFSLGYKGGKIDVAIREHRIACRALWAGITPEESLSERVLSKGIWYDFCFLLDLPQGSATFTFSKHGFDPTQRPQEVSVAFRPVSDDYAADLTVAAQAADRRANQWLVREPFNGRIANLKAFFEPLDGQRFVATWLDGQAPRVPPNAAWDFAQQAGTELVPDVITGRYSAHTINRPTRFVAGPDYAGQVQNPMEGPEFFNAAHFHDDDLCDAGWEESFEFAVPQSLRSGAYAFFLISDQGEDHIPFFVTPTEGREKSRVAVLMPTVSYQVYANMTVDPEFLKGLSLFDEDLAETPAEAYVRTHRLRSCYDHHSDGSGVSMATNQRPLVIFIRSGSLGRGINGPHQFPADLFILDWLEEKGIEYDIVTDHQLHGRGVAALSPYRAVVSGSHSEYWTSEMLDGLKNYTDQGGRFLNISGNSLYWATALSDDGSLVEIRRVHGLRSWAVPAAEGFLSLSGTYGDTWREHGRPAQRYVGTGFAAMGVDEGRPFTRTDASYHSRAAVLFEGITDNLIGDTPTLILARGAAGMEFDRADVSLGTPSHALILASATGFSNSYQLAIDDVPTTTPYFGGPYHPDVRCDILFYETPNGGAVFSAPSIAWTSALSHNGYDNSVSQLTYNVLMRFIKEGPVL